MELDACRRRLDAKYQAVAILKEQVSKDFCRFYPTSLLRTDGLGFCLSVMRMLVDSLFLSLFISLSSSLLF